MGPEYSDGVDMSLIRWMLAMSPAERLQTLQEFVDFVSAARGASLSRDGGGAVAVHAGTSGALPDGRGSVSAVVMRGGEQTRRTVEFVSGARRVNKL